MPKDDISPRRRALLLDVIQAAAEVGRLVREARDLNPARGARHPRRPRRSDPLGRPAGGGSAIAS
jgi:hypothetical protein